MVMEPDRLREQLEPRVEREQWLHPNVLEAVPFVGSMPGMIHDVHQTAMEKGWWDQMPRNVGELIALMHSEVSEGKQALYKGNIDYVDGLVEEMADVVIRIFDMVGGLDKTNLLEQDEAWQGDSPMDRVPTSELRFFQEMTAEGIMAHLEHPDNLLHPVGEAVKYDGERITEPSHTEPCLCEIHNQLSQALEFYRDYRPGAMLGALAYATSLSTLTVLVARRDFLMKLEDKMEENRHRDERHGGKLA